MRTSDGSRGKNLNGYFCSSESLFVKIQATASASLSGARG